MKLFYITRVNIPSRAAQSVQIESMCKAFSMIENISFKLVSPKNFENNILKNGFYWNKIKLKSRFKYLEFSIKSFQIIKREKPTHIFTRDILIAFISIFFRKIVVSYEAHKEPRTIIAKLLMKFLQKQSNFYLITISKALQQFYIDKYLFQNNKVRFFHDGVFIEKYSELRKISKDDLRKELNLSINKTIVIHTGSLHKGDDAKLFKYVIANFKDLLFVQVGGSEEDILKYKVYYKKYKNIIFIGHQNQDNIVKYQMSADLLFYALTKSNKLWRFTSPLKIFEYMATNIPILGSNIGSVQEILNKSNSIIFNPENEESIIDGVNYFKNNRNETLLLSKNALNDILNQYTWQNRAKFIISYIRN